MTARKRTRITATAAVTAASLAFGAGPAMAYIGPGAGLSLLGALWGIIAAVVAALLFLLLWPLRRMMRRQSATAAGNQTKRTSAQPQEGSTPPQRR